MESAEIISGLLQSPQGLQILAGALNAHPQQSEASEVDAILAGLNLTETPANAATDLVLAGLGMGSAQPKLADVKTQVLANILGRNAVAVKETPPTKARHWPLPFDSGTVLAPGEIRPIIQNPQVVYKPTTFIVPSDTAGSFAIRDITIGQRSQFATPGALPARMFQEDSTQNDLELDTAQVSMSIIVQVENISLGPVRFLGGMKGIAVQ